MVVAVAGDDGAVFADFNEPAAGIPFVVALAELLGLAAGAVACR